MIIAQSESFTSSSKKETKPKTNKFVSDKDDIDTVLNLKPITNTSKGFNLNPLFENVDKKIKFKDVKSAEESVFEGIKDPGVKFTTGDIPVTPLSAKIGSRNKNPKGGNIDIDEASRGLFEKDFVEIPGIFDKEYSEALNDIFEYIQKNPQAAELVAPQIQAARYAKGSSPLMKRIVLNRNISHQPLIVRPQSNGGPMEDHPIATSIAALGGAGAVGLGAYNITKEK